MKFTRQGVRDLDHAQPVVGLVVPANGPALAPPAPRVENPEHDSLVVKFDQIEGLLEELTDRPRENVWIVEARKRRLSGDALKIVRELRRQVLK